MRPPSQLAFALTLLISLLAWEIQGLGGPRNVRRGPTGGPGPSQGPQPQSKQSGPTQFGGNTGGPGSNVVRPSTPGFFNVLPSAPLSSQNQKSSSPSSPAKQPSPSSTAKPAISPSPFPAAIPSSQSLSPSFDVNAPLKSPSPAVKPGQSPSKSSSPSSDNGGNKSPSKVPSSSSDGIGDKSPPKSSSDDKGEKPSSPPGSSEKSGPPGSPGKDGGEQNGQADGKKDDKDDEKKEGTGGAKEDDKGGKEKNDGKDDDKGGEGKKDGKDNDKNGDRRSDRDNMSRGAGERKPRRPIPKTPEGVTSGVRGAVRGAEREAVVDLLIFAPDPAPLARGFRFAATDRQVVLRKTVDRQRDADVVALKAIAQSVLDTQEFTKLANVTVLSVFPEGNDTLLGIFEELFQDEALVQEIIDADPAVDLVPSTGRRRLACDACTPVNSFLCAHCWSTTVCGNFFWCNGVVAKATARKKGRYKTRKSF